jgi:putative component of toxin-antitoxin plasmid stabilization module
MIFELRKIPLFEEKFSKIIPLNKQEDTNKRISKLQYNPYSGKPLGFRYLRELKIDKFRVYYLIYEKEVIILLVTVSNKKQQQNTIKFIKDNINEFQKIVKNLKEN